MRVECAAILVIVVLALSACGSSESTLQDDAGVALDASPPARDLPQDIVVDAPEPPERATAPALPSLPMLTPCPAGSRELAPSEPDEPHACEPWPNLAAQPCSGAQARLPGTDGCVSIGTECPSLLEGSWPESIPPARPALYVRPSGSPAPDGSIDAPFARIEDAIAAASDGTTIVLSLGVFEVDTFSLPAGVAVLGACPEGTILRSTVQSDDDALIDVAAPGVEVADLRIEGRRLGVIVRTGGEARLSRVAISGQGAGIWVRGGRVIAERVLVRDVVSRTIDGTLGEGVRVSDRGSFDAIGLVIERASLAGVRLTGRGSTATIDNMSASALRADVADLRGGFAVYLEPGTTATVSRAAVESAKAAGFFVALDSTLTLRDIVVRDTASLADGTAGFGLVSFGKAHVRRALFDRNRTAGVFAADQAMVALEDVVIRATESERHSRQGGYGVFGQGNAHVRATRVEAVSNRTSGVGLLDASAHLQDLIVRDTRSSLLDDRAGMGVTLDGQGTVKIERALIERSRYAGLLIDRAASSSTELSDVTVRDTQTERSTGRGGFGFYLGEESIVDGRRLASIGNRSVGVVLVRGANAMLSDLEVADTTASEELPLGGEGLVVSDGSTLSGSRIFITRSRATGLRVTGLSSFAELSDVIVTDTASSDDGSDSFGTGIDVVAGSRLVLLRALLAGNRQSGLSVGDAGSFADLSDIVVSETRSRRYDRVLGIGLRITNESAAIARRVRVERNRTSGISVEHGSTLELESFVIADTEDEEASLVHGKGLFCTLGSTLRAKIGRLERNRSAGIIVSRSRAELSDIGIFDMRGSERHGLEGVGLWAQLGSSVEGDGLIIRSARTAGILALSSTTSVDLRRVVIRDVLERECASSSCSGYGAGIGLVAADRANVKLDEFEITRCALAGVQLGSEASVALSNGEVSSNPIAVNLQVRDYDLGRLMKNVIYRDNHVDLDALELPVPAAMEFDVGD